MVNGAPLLPISEQIFWIVLGGAIGGLAEMFLQLEFRSLPAGQKSESDKNAGRFFFEDACFKWYQALSFSVLSIFVGISGAIAIEFVLMLLGTYRGGIGSHDELFLISISTAAGFGARRLLPRIASQLEAKVNLLEQQDRTRETQLEETRRELEIVQNDAKESLLFLRAQDAGKPTALPALRKFCIDELRAKLKKEPAARRYAFQLSHLYKVCGQFETVEGEKMRWYEKALKCMDDFISALAQPNDHDHADALYNKACYASILWTNTGTAAYKVQALEWLEQSIKKQPASKNDARVDSDFEKFRTDQDAGFKKIVES